MNPIMGRKARGPASDLDTVPDAILNGSNFFCEFSARFAAREAS